MNRPMKWLTRGLAGAEEVFDWAKYRARMRGAGPFRLEAYRGHGTPEVLRVHGRVLEGEAIPPASEHDSAWRNLRHTVRRLQSDEVPAARVLARHGEHTVEALADEEGYFSVRLDLAVPLGEGRPWQPVELELLDPRNPDGSMATATAWVVVPERDARLGVISDIDDTVVKTDVANLLRMLRLVLLTNAHTRLPFPGVASFYRALQRGATGGEHNPIFYVSSSPWNFYDLLNEVFEVHGVPEGPLFLKDYGLARDVLLSTGHQEHKLDAMEEILTTHSDLRWVLLGDSGQHDPEIYLEIVRRYPGRVAAIYIRDVSATTRDDQVHAMAREAARQGVDLVLVRDTVAAARHAAAQGLIHPGALTSIADEIRRDRKLPGPVESVVRGGGSSA